MDNLSLFLSSSPTLLVGLCAFFGLLVGSFLNVVIYRLPEMMMRSWRHEAREILELPEEPDNEIFNLVTPRSRCPKCQHAIAWYENVPVVSWLALKGRCRGCATPISQAELTRLPSLAVEGLDADTEALMAELERLGYAASGQRAGPLLAVAKGLGNGQLAGTAPGFGAPCRGPAFVGTDEAAPGPGFGLGFATLFQGFQLGGGGGRRGFRLFFALCLFFRCFAPHLFLPGGGPGGGR